MVHKASACISEVLAEVTDAKKRVCEKGEWEFLEQNGESEREVSVCECLNFSLTKGSLNDTKEVLMRDYGCSSVVVNARLIKPE
jgi:hypothetical protein